MFALELGNRGLTAVFARPISTSIPVCSKVLVGKHHRYITFIPWIQSVALISTSTRKFMQTLDSKHFVELEVIAKRRGITLQQLVRAVVVPEWMEGRNGEQSPARRR